MNPRVILVPTDGSAAARTALELATLLAKGAAAEVVLVHASPPLAEAVFEANPLTRLEAEEIAADPVLGDAAAFVQSEGVAMHARLIGEGGTDEIADAVLGIASSVGADLIVMGSRGRSGFRETWLGSVSRGVASRSEVPVVVVHPPAGD